MRRVVFASWDDAVHLTEAMKQAQLATMDPFLRDARTRGIPFLGSGAVYPVATETFEIRPFEIPDNWPRAFGMDVGFNRTAAIWGALDPASDILYLYDEHYVGEETPQTHAAAIMGWDTPGKLRGKWIPGVVDPHANDRSQADGIRLMQTYRDMGLDLSPAANAVEAGVHQVWIRLSSGRLKVFSHLQYFFKEFMLYRRDENGKIVKRKSRPDHILDSLKYLVLSGLSKAIPVPVGGPNSSDYEWGDPELQFANSWMGS